MDQKPPEPPMHEQEAERSDWERFVHNAQAFWYEYGQWVMTVLAVVLAIAAGLLMWNNYTKLSRQQAWTSLATASSPEGYEQVARDYPGHQGVRSLALLRAADLLLYQASVPEAVEAQREAEAAAAEAANSGQDAEQDPEDPFAEADMPSPEPLPEIDPEIALDRAAALYTDVIEHTQADLLYRLNARLGLGAVAEAQGDWEQARRQWEQVEAVAGELYPAIAAQARQRLDRMADLQRPVMFATAPPAPVTQPDGEDPLDIGDLQTESPLAPVPSGEDESEMTPTNVDPLIDTPPFDAGGSAGETEPTPGAVEDEELDPLLPIEDGEGEGQNGS